MYVAGTNPNALKVIKNKPRSFVRQLRSVLRLKKRSLKTQKREHEGISRRSMCRRSLSQLADQQTAADSRADIYRTYQPEIAIILKISVRTVEVHRFSLMRNLNVRNVAQLLRRALHLGLLSSRQMRSQLGGRESARSSSSLIGENRRRKLYAP